MIVKSEEKTGFEPKLPDGTSLGMIFEDFTKQLPQNVKGIFVFTLKPGASFAPHGHQGESEIYFVTEGEVTLVDSGTERICRAGDLMITDGEETHGGRNHTDSDVKMLGMLISH